jgi:hypothetical protein
MNDFRISYDLRGEKGGYGIEIASKLAFDREFIERAWKI